MKEMIERIRRNLNIKGLWKLITYPSRPIKRELEKNKIREEYTKLTIHYDEVIKKIRENGKEKIRFGAYVVFDSTFGAKRLLDLMIESDDWEFGIVIIPDISRGYEHMITTYKCTRDFFVNKYGTEFVYDGYDVKTGEFYDLSEEFDVVYCANPYDSMVNEIHSIKYLSSKECLPIHISYGYDVGSYTTKSRLTGYELNYCWKCFTDTVYSHNDYKKMQSIKGKNTELVGYAKMDSFDNLVSNEKEKKKILFSAHHTVSMKELPLANFLRFPNLIFELNAMFPDIDFVFRPHPLLFTTLVNNNLWTQDMVNEYIERLIDEGIEYSCGGDYLQLFSDCDAIINDCGSFTVEWLYTGKPGCFVFNPLLRKKNLTVLMQKAMSHYKVVSSREEIIDFVTRFDKGEFFTVVEDWVKNDIMLAFPHVSEKILSCINIKGRA